MQFNGYGSNWILSSLKAGSADDLVPDDPRKELLEYLNSPLEAPGEGEKELDPIKWWGVCILCLMRPTFTKLHHSTIQSSTQCCHDLAIQGSSVASKRSFSSSGITDTLHRNCMDPFLFGRVQILEHAYKSHLIDARADAHAHEVLEAIQI